MTDIEREAIGHVRVPFATCCFCDAEQICSMHGECRMKRAAPHNHIISDRQAGKERRHD